MHYNFQCPNHSCEDADGNPQIQEISCLSTEIQDIQSETNGASLPTCEICQSKMFRLYSAPPVRKFKGKITPSVVQTPDGKTHKLSQNLWRN